MEKRKALISILNYNGSQDTINCIKSFYSYENRKDYCIVIWDNHSKKDQQEELRSSLLKLESTLKICTYEQYHSIDLQDYEIVLVFSYENLGFAKGNNRVIENQLDKFEYIILLNNDTIFEYNTTYHLMNYLDKHASIGVATSSIYYYYKKDSVWNAGGKVFFGTRKYYTEKYVNQKIKEKNTEKLVDYITGCYLVAKSDIFQKYGLLTEKFFFGEEDYEFCKRMKKNKVKLAVLLDQKIYHKVGASITKNDLSIISIVRKSFVHHLNRFIDMKEFYSFGFWQLWRLFSSIYIYFLMLKISRGNWLLITKYVILLNYYGTMKSDVNKSFFHAVLDGKII